jgi:tungstate transport system ATP-binding protein
MTDAPLYRLDNLVRRQGDGFVLGIPQLEIRPGEVIGLLGPTGAGKTTLLRLLSGLESPHEGEIRFRAQPLNGGTPLILRRQIAMIPQRPLLLGGSVRRNVEYGLRLRGAVDASRVEKMLADLELRPIAAQNAQTLSGGQTQLVALARALVIEPDVLLLDEPTANLDPAHVALVEQAIGRFRQEKRATIIWATHNLFQARRVADRVALLLAGQLIELAATHDFFERPADPRAAAFVEGRMIW